MKHLFFILIISLIFSACKKDDTIEDTRIKGCAPILEEAVRCQALLPQCQGTGTGKSGICLGTTNAGNRCSRTMTDICGFCWQHVEQNTGRCPLDTKNECGYCDAHLDMFQGK